MRAAPSRGSLWAAPRVAPGWSASPYRVWGYGFAVEPSVVVAAPPGPVDNGEAAAEGEYLEPPPRIVAAISGDATIANQGALLGVQTSFEGSRFGLIAAYTGVLTTPVDSNSSDAVDVLHLAQARLTCALLSGDRGRLRAEVGAHVAVAPDVTFVAPGFGLSGVLGLAGPLGIEGRLYGNVWPYTQVDARAGLTVASARVGVSLGYRMLYLNDNGALGAANAGATSDLYRGPYVSLALAL